MAAAALVRKGARLARRQAGRIADLVYPPDIYCICCGRDIQPGRLYSMCDDCLSDINWANGKLCASCGKPLEDWYPDMYCSECINKDRRFDAGVTCFQYKEAERMMIREFKYHGKSYMARNLSEILFDKVVAVSAGCDILVPVPMFKKKEKKRGYNQAALLAKLPAPAAARAGSCRLRGSVQSLLLRLPVSRLLRSVLSLFPSYICRPRA